MTALSIHRHHPHHHDPTVIACSRYRIGHHIKQELNGRMRSTPSVPMTRMPNPLLYVSLSRSGRSQLVLIRSAMIWYHVGDGRYQHVMDRYRRVERVTSSSCSCSCIGARNCQTHTSRTRCVHLPSAHRHAVLIGTDWLVLLVPIEDALESGASEMWTKFYTKHQNRFFQSRNYLHKEHPELHQPEVHTLTTTSS
jgi:hypothetical protein